MKIPKHIIEIKVNFLTLTRKSNRTRHFVKVNYFDLD